MRTLVVDNNIMPEFWGAKDLARNVVLQGGGIVEVRRAPQNDLPPDLDRYDRIILSGSMTGATDEAPWIAALERAIHRWVDTGKPLLGICYGHQLIARALGGKAVVRRGARAEFGWAKINQTADSRLLSDLPTTFYSFAWHLDEVYELPKGLRTIARSEICSIQAFDHIDKPIFGVQFHPERNLEEGERDLRKRLVKSMGKQTEVLPGSGKTLFDLNVAKTIFRNFLAL